MGKTMTQLENLLVQMWADYCQINPEAKRVFDVLTAEGEQVLNDHIALRTFNHPRLGISSLSKHFIDLGYEIADQEYVFTEKKLFAKHFMPPNDSLPKIFISELELEKVSPFIRETINKLIDQVDSSVIESATFAMSGRPWDLSYELYSQLAKESEYASWVAAFGFRPNHFTVNINNLKKYSDIKVLNSFLKSKGFVLNSFGGEIKGTPEEHLEQSSTMASDIAVSFSDGTHKIPGCYYEFAKRYPQADGKLYQGFIAKSADKIFESTNQLK
jgi:hypothetical protein